MLSLLVPDHTFQQQGFTAVFPKLALFYVSPGVLIPYVDVSVPAQVLWFDHVWEGFLKLLVGYWFSIRELCTSQERHLTRTVRRFWLSQWERWVATPFIWWVEMKQAAQHPTVCRTAPHTENYPVMCQPWGG